jgi:hypothetical protein
MTLDPRAVALHGVGYQPLLVAVQGLVPFDPEPPSQPGGGGMVVPLRFVPFNPVRPRRPRKKRQTDILFMH